MAADKGKVFRRVPLIHVPDKVELCDIIPFGHIPVAVEIAPGATPLPQFNHPQYAFYVFGPEDGSIRSDILDWCPHIVQIPSDGCLNLAGAVNVVLYDRRAKEQGCQTNISRQFDLSI